MGLRPALGTEKSGIALGSAAAALCRGGRSYPPVRRVSGTIPIAAAFAIEEADPGNRVK
jgi:hypothetical protein